MGRLAKGKKGEKRGEGGRFLPGHCGGPGNPYARRVAKLRALMHKTITDKDVQDVLTTLLNRSKAGDMPAITLLLAYLIGRPDSESEINVDKSNQSSTVTIRFEDVQPPA